MCGLMALPDSSASVEQIFSQINMVKTAKINKKCDETVACHHIKAKQAITRVGFDRYACTMLVYHYSNFF